MGVSADASGKYSLALGSGDVSGDYTDGNNHPSASGEKSIAIGHNSNASDESAIAIGSSSKSDKVSATALGRNTTATGVNSSAIGAYSIANATDATALGRNANATAGQSTALGTYSVASGQYGTGVGYQANASGSNSTAVGVSAKANKEGASAMGPGARAYGNGAISFGYQALSGANIFNSAGNGSFNDASPDVTSYAKWGDSAIGLRAIASGGNATALGRSATATAANAIAIGGGNGDSATDNTEKTEATGEKSTAIGYNAKAKTANDLAVGRGAASSGGSSTALGYDATSSGEGSVAIGAGTDALGAMPAKQVKATAKNAIAIGRATQATSQDATAIGTDATASNTDAIAIGRKSNASGSTSIGFGYNTQSTDTNTVAIGTDVSATAESAIALGRKTTASGLSSTAVGPLANASGKYSSAFGMSTSAANEGSLALGNGASATVDNGVALGSGSKANVGSGTAGFDPHASRNDPYTNLSGNTLTSTWGAVAVGDGTNTRQIIGVAAGTNDTDAVNVAQLKALNLAFTTDGNAGDVNLTNTLSVNGDTDYIATSGGTGQLTISGKIKDISVDANGTATASKGLANAANVAAAINDANAAQTIKYKANGTGNNSVKLSDGLNFTNGATTTATVGANGQVSFDLNTATKQSITDSATAVARTISLGGDTGTTTAKSLSSDNVNFGIKSGSPTYLTTKATGNDVTLTINEQAIKNAAKDASSFKVKANATAAEDVKGGDTVTFNDGDNIAITQTGKTFKIATAKNVTFDAATIGGNTTIGSTGITTNKVTVGTVSIDGTNGINAGGKAITHVGTGRVSNSSTDDGNVANIGDVKAIANNAVANLSTELGITDGTTSGTSTVNLKTEKLKVVGTGVAKTTVNGQTITVDVAKGTLTNNTTTGALTGTAGVVDANDMATAVNTAITKAVDTATGTQKLDISAGGTDNSVNLKTQKLTVAGTGAATASLNNQTITVNVAEGTFTNKSDGTTSATAGVAKATDVAAAINNANSVLGNKITAATQSLSTLGDNKFKLTADSTSTTGQALNKSGGLSFKIAGDGDLVSTSATTDTINVTVKKGTLSTNTDGTINKTADGVVTADNMKTVVNDAITKAVTSAKDGSAWNISTNGGTATKVSGGNTVDLKGGDNIVVEQDSTDGKKITVKTKKDLTLDSVTAANTVKVGSGTNLITLDGTSGAVSGNTFTGTTFTSGAASMNATGFRLTGGPSVTTTGIDAGSAAITNVASGGTTGTNAANIADVKQIAKDTVNNAVTKLSSTLTVTDGTTDGNVSLKTDKLKVVGTGAATANVNGQTITIGVAKGTLTNDTDGKVKSTGTGVATTDEVESTVNNAISKAVTNSTAAVNTLGANTLTLTADSNSTTGQALNQSGGLSFKVAGDGTFISTSAAGDTVTVSVKQGVFGSNADGTAKSTTNGVATTDNVADIVNTTVSNAVNNVTSNQNLKIGGDTTAANSAVNLKNDTLSVKGDNKYISTAASGKDITLTVNEQAIKDAAKDASSFKVKANSTAAEDVKGGDTVTFNNGDNIAITQTGKTFKIATAKNVTFDTATIGTNTTIGSTGITTNKVNVGNISIDGTDGINAGGKAITHVGTGRVANSNADDTNVANIGDVKAIATDAVANLSTNLGITDGTTSGTVNLKNQSLKVVGTGAAKATVNGQTITVDVAKGTLTNNTTTGALTGTAGVVDANDMAAAVNTAITKAVDNATGTQALNLTDGTNTGSVKLSTQTLSVSGTNGVEATVGGQGITIGLDTATKNLISNSSTAVDNLGKNTFTLKADSTDTTAQDLNKSGGLAFKVAGDGNFITTSAATDTVTVSIKQGTFGSNTDGTAKSTTNGVATTNDVANIVNTTVTNAVTKATGSQVLNITDGNNNGSINLKNDALKVVGADGVTTAVSGKTITVGLDTATKDKINNASTATNKNISLAADTGNASSQSLKDGDVSFAVKGASGDYISTNMNGSTVEISTKRATINSNAATGEASVTGNDGLATAKNVADAINAATAKAVSQSAWKLAADGTTGTETISGGDTVNFKAGSNMEVSRTGKDITYKTKDNVAFTTVTAGTGANEVKLDGNTGTVTAKDITATGDVTAKNVTTSGNVTAAGTVKGDTVQGNTVKAGNVTITGGTTNTITGLSNTTWTPAGGIQADRAATEGQLQQAINQVNATVGSTALTFKGDTNPAQSMTLQGNTFAITGDTMIKTTTNTNGIGLSLDTSKVNIAYAANGLNGQTTSLASGLNFTDGDHTKATVAASGVVKYDAKTSTISVANGHATSSGNDLATADNVADAINQMTQNNSGNTTQLRQEISKVATETQRVGAHAAAMAALKPIQYDPLAPTQIMAGVGNYRGESAAALGIAHYTNDNTMFNVGVSVGGNHNMINAGVTHKFGISAEKKNIPDRYKAGPISSIYVMQDEMTQLRSENEAYKAKLDKQQSEIDALKAAVDQLLASKA